MEYENLLYFIDADIGMTVGKRKFYLQLDILTDKLVGKMQ